MLGLKPYKLFGPGDHIKDEMEFYGWKQKDLAEILDISEKHLNQILNNKISITVLIAKKLSEVFKQSPQFWLNLDSNYRIRLEESAENNDVAAKALIFRYMPINEMRKREWLDKSQNEIKELRESVKKYWKINDLKHLDVIYERDNIVNFRKSENSKNYQPYYVITWLQRVKQIADTIKLNEYKRENLIELGKKLANYTIMPDGIEKFIKELNKIGIKFIVLSHLKNTYIDGATFLYRKNPVIAYTARYDRIDNFWFTVAHEIGHIINHLSETEIVDNFDEKSEEKIEVEANKFTESQLKTSLILECTKEYIRINRARIELISQKLKIHPAVIVGTLHYHKKLDYKYQRNYLYKATEFIPQKYQHA